MHICNKNEKIKYTKLTLKYRGKKHDQPKRARIFGGTQREFVRDAAEEEYM